VLFGDKMRDFEFFFEKMMNYYNVSTIKDLAAAIDTQPSTVSNWNQRKSVSALKKKCRELGIYQDIFAGGYIDQSQASFDNGSAGVDFSTQKKVGSGGSPSPIDELDESTRYLLFSVLAKYKDNQSLLQQKIIKLLAENE
jgi:hypothetical protein